MARHSEKSQNCRTKFALYNLAGTVKAYYLVDGTNLEQSEAVTEHSIAVEEPLIKDYDYQVFVSHSARKINGSSHHLKIVGLTPGDRGKFYKYRQLGKSEYEALTEIPVRQTDESVFAFAKANLAEGNLNLAKYALASTFDVTLTAKHAKALTKSEIAAMMRELERAIFHPVVLKAHKISAPLPTNDKISVLALLEMLARHKNRVIVNIKDLQQTYARRGIKRVPGQRGETGELLEPSLKTDDIHDSEYVRIAFLKMNRNAATINMAIARSVKLVKVGDRTQITEVAGTLATDLNTYKSYSIVSDGELNVKSLKVKFGDKKLVDLLKEKGVLASTDEFDFRKEYELDLSGLPLVPLDAHYSSLDGIFEELAEIKALSSIISAQLKTVSDVYVDEQIEELKQHYLSKNLYLNFPTTTDYGDLQEAIDNGTVDARASHQIDIGNRDILNLGKIPAANQFLNGFYEVYDRETGDRLEKPTFAQLLDKDVVVGHKTLSKRTKIAKADELMKPLFDNFLGLEDNGSIKAILSKVGARKLWRLLRAKFQGKTVSKVDFVKALTVAKMKLDRYSEKLYAEKISPLVFYIGATGLIPDEMNAVARTAAEMSAKYASLTFSKHERDGMFFELGNSAIGVCAKTQYYSTSARGLI